MTDLAGKTGLCRSTSDDPGPTVVLTIGLAVSPFELLRRHLGRLEYGVPGVVLGPVSGQNASFGIETGGHTRARIGSENVECCCLDPLSQSPVDGSFKDARVILVKAEDEAPVDHDAEIVQFADGFSVVVSQIVPFPLRSQGFGRERLKPDEETAESARNGVLQRVASQHGPHRPRGLPEPVHAFHADEEGIGELRTAEQMVVKEVEVPAGKLRDLGKRPVDSSGVERPASAKEALLVAEIAAMRAAPRHDDGVRDEVCVHGANASANDTPTLPLRTTQGTDHGLH